MLANVDFTTRAESAGKSMRMLLSDTFVVIIAGIAVFVAVVLWAKYMRNRRKRVSGGEKVYRSISPPAETEDGQTEIRVRYKRRVRRRGHRNRNPTLSEIGGLPAGEREGGESRRDPS